MRVPIILEPYIVIHLIFYHNQTLNRKKESMAWHGSLKDVHCSIILRQDVRP